MNRDAAATTRWDGQRKQNISQQSSFKACFIALMGSPGYGRRHGCTSGTPGRATAWNPKTEFQMPPESQPSRAMTMANALRSDTSVMCLDCKQGRRGLRPQGMSICNLSQGQSHSDWAFSQITNLRALDCAAYPK